MFHTGFSMSAEEFAEDANGPGIAWLKQQAAARNCALYTSLIASENGNYLNRGVFVQPDGTVHTYDKRKCFTLAGEDRTYTAGTREVIVDFRGWKLQLQICYDLRFPEIVRNRLEADGRPAYDAILYVANWPQRRSLHWQTLLRARAIENQCYVLAAAQGGIHPNGRRTWGHSMLVDPWGEISASLPEGEGLVMGELDLGRQSSVRESLPALAHRTR
jgi:predicted amidohydrolase